MVVLKKGEDRTVLVVAEVPHAVSLGCTVRTMRTMRTILVLIFDYL